MSLIKEYFELIKKYQEEYGENTVLLMQVGAFFEVYAIKENDNSEEPITTSNIMIFSQICELNVVDKNTCVGNNNILMAGFKDIQIEKYIKKLQNAGFTVVVYVQDEAAKNTTRSLAGIFSPGTYFQPDSEHLTNSTTCIWVDLVENKVLMKGKFVTIGIANIDIYTGKTTIFQFKETYANNPTTYDELERFISIHNPNEVILISNLPDEKEMDYIINYSGISCSLVHKIHTESIQVTEKMKRVKNCEKQPYQKEVLSKFYHFDDYQIFSQNFYEYHIATQACCFLLDFIYQHNPHLVNKILEPEFENCSTRLILANHCLKQLNIINDGAVKSSKYSCVSNLLNDCLTPMGKRQFLYNLLNPGFDEEYLQREYDITEYFLTKFETYNGFMKKHLTTIKDISKCERQIFIQKMSPKTFFNLYNNVITIQKIFEEIITDTTIKEYLLLINPNIINVGSYCDEITQFISDNLDLSIAKELDNYQHFDTNFIKPSISEPLDKQMETFNESNLKLEEIRNYLSLLIGNREKKGSDYVKYHETEKNNLGLTCTVRRSNLLKDILPKEEEIVKLSYSLVTNDDVVKKMKTFDFKVSKTQFQFEKQNSTNHFIVDPQIRVLCLNISTIKVEMKETITTVFRSIISKFEIFQKQIESLIHFVTLVDLVYTKSSIAKKYNYCKPNIISSAKKSFVEANQLRHCLIEQFQTNELYVTNDIMIGTNKENDVKNGYDGMLLYGTNAVGKTCFIRSLGVAVIMAQSGLYVPCTTFNFKPYQYLFTRIIGNDNIFKGLSTFAVEMSELRTILRLGNENSLILGDELCSGTEILSAISIFVAGIQHLHKCRSSFIFATHLHEIVNYDEIVGLDSVVLKHMEVIYDKERDQLIYDRKLKDGPGDSMYGLEVCKSLNLPREFLDVAYEIRMKYNPETRNPLSLKTSSYNSNKIVNICEKCNKKQGKEVHHLQPQVEANSSNGFISTEYSVFHKNNLANLMTLCESCHDEIHKTNKSGGKKVKTTKGIQIKNTLTKV